MAHIPEFWFQLNLSRSMTQSLSFFIFTMWLIMCQKAIVKIKWSSANNHFLRYKILPKRQYPHFNNLSELGILIWREKQRAEKKHRKAKPDIWNSKLRPHTLGRAWGAVLGRSEWWYRWRAKSRGCSFPFQASVWFSLACLFLLGLF